MRAWLPLLAAGVLAGCGSPGDPLPPALNRPARVNDLAVVERGAQISASFTLPVKTTEDLPLKAPPDIELRAGPIGDRFVQQDWEQASDRIPPEAIKVDSGRVDATIPALKYVGRTVAVGVRLHGPKGQDVGWAIDIVNVLPELPTPQSPAAKDAPGGVVLEWTVPRPAAEFRIFRRLQNDKEWTLAGTSDKTSYLDTGIEYGKTYEYLVQAGEKTGAKYAESEDSAVISIKPADRFPPAVVTGVAAVPATKSIELVWDGSKDADTAFYRVYRDNVLLADSVQSPSFSDRDVTGGAKHSYQITAVDSANNESARSAPVEATLP
ncbi:MAG: Fibronectin, type domain protein [Bryobacterales bacterium]|nr:Fibronectin, type domain protein [Bryobacterales bacterium]